MRRLLPMLLFAVFMLALGAQAMIVLERGAWVILTLGQCLALFYWPDPAGASLAIDAAAGQVGMLAAVLQVPAGIAFGALWLSVRALVRRSKR